MFGKKGALAQSQPSGTARRSAPVRPSTVSYRVSGQIGPILVIMFCCLGAAVIFAAVMMSHDPSAVIRRLGIFGQEGARIFAAIMMFASMGGFLLTSLALARRFGPDRFIKLDQHAVFAHTSLFSSRVVRIPFNEISRLRLLDFKGSYYLEIRSRDGKKIGLGEVAFDSKAEILECFDQLQQSFARPK